MDRYKEALERAKAGKPMDEVFPELNESEDERIREELVEYFSHTGCNFIRGIPIGRVRDYLEKLKEQRPADIAPNQFDGITYGMSGASTDHSKEWSEDEKIMSDIIFAIKEVWMEADADRMIAYLERHKEPFIIHDTGCSKRGAKMPEYCLDVKPAEWSEEDEAFLKVAIAICNRYSHKDIAGWLESLRPQPKQEWSEKDERIVDHCIGYIEASCLDAHDFYECVEWLKSLRPKPHWYPSKEQMGALENAYNDTLKVTDCEILLSLYLDLQKYYSL